MHHVLHDKQAYTVRRTMLTDKKGTDEANSCYFGCTIVVLFIYSLFPRCTRTLCICTYELSMWERDLVCVLRDCEASKNQVMQDQVVIVGCLTQGRVQGCRTVKLGDRKVRTVAHVVFRWLKGLWRH